MYAGNTFKIGQFLKKTKKKVIIKRFYINNERGIHDKPSLQCGSSNKFHLIKKY